MNSVNQVKCKMYFLYTHVQNKYIGRTNIDGSISLSGYVSVELSVIVVPLERVELSDTHIVGTTQGLGCSGE